MRTLGTVVAAGVAALISTSAMAQDATSAISSGNSELSVNGFLTYAGGTTVAFGGFSYGSFIDDATLLKIGVNASITSGGGFSSYTLGMRPAVNFYFPSEGSTTVPYITAYGNITAIKTSGAFGSTSTQYGGGAGVGAKFFIKENIAFGPEVDYEYNRSSGGGGQGQAIAKLELSAYF